MTAITPATGLPAGGTAVTITGANLADGVTVKFGDAKATAVTYLSSTKLSAVSPAGSAGAVTVTVTDKDGLTSASTVTFTYSTDATATPSPSPSPADKPRFTLGTVPKQGIGLVAFSGGVNDDLIAAATDAGCERVAQAFFLAVDGKFIVFFPAAPQIVNAAWNAHFGGTLPVDLALAMRCG
ncbi:MAG: IPT/TIG domain-containing protein [Chloroflexi bacterium]|nr:IPT/TIG domain-containing protein [Chloroflexota bacterium]